MIIKIKTNDFDFQKIFNSGLFYFFYEGEPKREIYFQKKIIELSFEQKKGYLIIKSPQDINDKNKLIERIKYCLGLEENLSEFYKICEKDKIFKNYLHKIKGTRIISAFSDFEALVGAIISQNNSYRNYRTQIFRVYKRLNFIPEKFNSKNLLNLKLGYKIPYLLELRKNFGKVDINEIKGIGNYSINLFNIFQLRDYNSFYIDCLIEKIMRENYKVKGDLEEISKKMWGKYRGLAEAYLQRFFEVK